MNLKAAKVIAKQRGIKVSARRKNIDGDSEIMVGNDRIYCKVNHGASCWCVDSLEGKDYPGGGTHVGIAIMRALGDY
jgi:hypothetical protein